MLDADVRLDAWAVQTGVARRHLLRTLDESDQEIAEKGRQYVFQHLDRVMRNPTGYYLAHLRVHRDPNGKVVDDSGVVYGHWLEGDGSMNFPVTRFKGYAAFRRASQRLDREADRITDRHVARMIRRLS